MEGPILASVLSNTLPRLYTAIEGRMKKGGLERDVDSIKAELKYIKAAIGDYRKISPNDMSDLWRARIEDLRQLAYDIEDCVDSFNAGITDADDLPAKISGLKKSTEETYQRLERYISEESKQKRQQDPEDTISTDPDQDDDHTVVGMEELSDDIKALLEESQVSAERKLRVIYIVGFGGTGKTLLAQKVYADESSRFPRHAFVCAGSKDRKQVLEEILEKLHQQDVQPTSQGEHETNSPMDIAYVGNGNHGCRSSASSCNQHSQRRTDVRARLRSCLGTNRYLIVIDDIQAEEFGSYVLSAFPRVNQVDSRIIVTTTVESVAESCRSGQRHVYRMRPLNDEKSELLFLNVACEMELPSDAKVEQSMVVQKNCDGVPLALVSIARFCNGHLSRCEDAWKKLCMFTPESKKDFRLARMQRVLDRTYSSLSGLGLEPSLLYFCMFPRGHAIKRGSLMRQWMAEGPEVGCSTSVDAAANFQTFVDRNIIWPVQVSNNEKVKTCKPPAMMMEYISRMSEKEKFVMLSAGRNNVCDPQCIRRLSVQQHADATNSTGATDDGGQALLHDLLRLRTLAVFGEGDGDPLDFAKSVLLRVLNLEACHGLDYSHLEKICKLLKLLKYLSLRANITEVPRRIANLHWLETLDLGKKTVIMVPAEVLELPNLRHLLGMLEIFERDSEDKKLKRFLSGKSTLETLSGFVTSKSRGFPQLMRHMRRLRKVRIWCNSSTSSRNAKDLSRSIKEFVRKAERTPRITHSLSVDFYECTHKFLDYVLHNDDGTHSGGLSSLKLRGMVSPVPTFVSRLSGITELCLSSATLNWDAIIAGVSRLKVLEYLKLVADINIEGDVVIHCDQFTSLKRMCIVVVASSTVTQITVHAGALKHLVSLHLLCPGLDGHSANQIQHLVSLKEVALHSSVAQGTWKQAAREHSNRPNVVFLGRSSPGPNGYN